ncbi:response regulator [Phyllobacterium sp. SB3]|uniref:response regulator transcription factor n=1 Tax=Phyllobacterium sp. SB3 TaxID=3156073 RepID=UPI0032B0056C
MTPSPTIAVVDDDIGICEALAELLEVLGFQCETFEQPDDFLTANVNGAFDCLITDLNMKGMNGLELQKRLVSTNPQLPIIFMSAQSASEARSQALRSGAIAFLGKPINDEVLYRHIVSALNRGSV